MRTLTLIAVILAAIPFGLCFESEPASAASNCHIPTKLTPRAVSGKRGDRVDLVVRLTALGSAQSGFPVTFSWRSDATGWRALGTVKTGSKGYARWRGFKIPTNPAHDNVIIRAQFLKPSNDPDVIFLYCPSEARWRVSIGR